MTKIYFDYREKTREGFETKLPMGTYQLANESVAEIQGENVLEKIPNLIAFIDECYRLLPTGGTAIFSAPHFAHANSWASPLNVRGIAETSLNFASKDWREQTQYTEATVLANFEVQVSFAVEEAISARAEEVRTFWMHRYLNVAQAILFTLTKK